VVRRQLRDRWLITVLNLRALLGLQVVVLIATPTILRVRGGQGNPIFGSLVPIFRQLGSLSFG
jgi:hypothetical protein